MVQINGPRFHASADACSSVPNGRPVNVKLRSAAAPLRFARSGDIDSPLYKGSSFSARSTRNCHSAVHRKVNAMSRVTAPLLSFDGRGQIAKTQVYASWRGIPYVRRYTVPANPRSTDQTLTRTAFSFLNNVWKLAPADFIAPWTEASKGQQFFNRNLWLSKNTSMLRTASDLTGLIMSPGAKGGIASPVTVTPGNDQLTFAGVTPAPLPSGWSIVKMVGVAIKQQDPQAGTDFEINVVSDATDPYSVVMTGLDSVQAYVAAGWFVYQRSAVATDLAYSAAVGAEFTTT
jgi:hypothetical protein